MNSFALFPDVTDYPAGLLFILNGIIENHPLYLQISGWVSILLNPESNSHRGSPALSPTNQISKLVTNLGVNTEFEEQTKREGWLANNEFSERSSELVQDPTSGPG